MIEETGFNYAIKLPFIDYSLDEKETILWSGGFY